AFNAFQGQIIMQGQLLQPELSLITKDTVVWGPESQANTYTTSYQMGPKIAKFQDGSSVIVWVSSGQDTSSTGIYMKMLDAMGRNKTNEIAVNTYITNNQRNPAVSGLQDGSFIVVWESEGQDGSGYSIYTRLFYPTGAAKTGEIQVNAYNTNNQLEPDVCTLINNTAVIVWDSWQDADRYGVYLRLIDASTGAFLTNEIQVNTYTTNDQVFPAVSAFPDGSFVVAWASMNQTYNDWYDVYMKLFDATGTNITNEIRVNTHTTYNQYLPVVGTFSDGLFVVVWESELQDGENMSVFMKLFDATGLNKTNEIPVNTFVTGFQWEPAVSVLPDRHFVVSWSSDLQDGDLKGVFMKVFDDNGINLTGDTQVNTYYNSDQGFSDVSEFSSNSFIITWQSSGQDGDKTGIYFKNCTFDRVPTALGSVDKAVTVGTVVYINWTLYDDIEPGFFRVSANLSGTFQPISLWLTWTNNTPLILSVNTANVGLFVYRIEYNDSIGQMGIQNEILVRVSPSPPISGFGFLCVMLGLILIVTYAIRSKNQKFGNLA
ncbi:MAG: hypothetical protein LUQ65_11785, partial [Candidatus Helarchaeota archaeon]|nr:hypothetical protein [Candidatus Helarchaeota archaeon]